LAYRYTSFAFDLTPHITDPSADNVLAVRVRVLGQTSRWYSGAGIFRHVHLTTTPDIRVALYGAAASTLTVAPDRSVAVVRVAATLQNQALAVAPATAVTVVIFNPQSTAVATVTLLSPPIAAGRTVEVVFDAIEINGTVDGIDGVQLWTLDAPMLYTATVSTGGSGRQDAADADGTAGPGGDQDGVTVSFGIRTLSFTTEGGFLLNGESITMRGGCVHHDNGALGSAEIGRAD
jgi:beta-galactosidase